MVEVFLLRWVSSEQADESHVSLIIPLSAQVNVPLHCGVRCVLLLRGVEHAWHVIVLDVFRVHGPRMSSILLRNSISSILLALLTHLSL